MQAHVVVDRSKADTETSHGRLKKTWTRVPGNARRGSMKLGPCGSTNAHHWHILRLTSETTQNMPYKLDLHKRHPCSAPWGGGQL